MDPLTHMVAGALVGQAFSPDEPNRFAFGLVCAGAGVVADVDFVARKAEKATSFLKLHRGFTHSLVALPIIGVCAAASGSLLFGAPFWALLVASMAAAATHLVLDIIMHATGLKIFWPSQRKFALHLLVGLNPLTSSARCGERSLGVCLRCSMHSAVINPFVLLLWAGFLATLFLPTWQAVSAAVLGAAGAYLLLLRLLRWRAGAVLGRGLGQGERGQVFSGSFNPLVWVGVVTRADGHEVKQVNALSGKVEAFASHGPSETGAAVAASEETETVEEFLNTAVVPHATLYKLGDQPLVIWRDLAFAFSPTVSLFAARVLLDEQGEVKAEEFRERWDHPPETGASRQA